MGFWFWIKCDDFIEGFVGGNKLCKFEFLVVEVMVMGVMVFVIVGVK